MAKGKLNRLFSDEELKAIQDECEAEIWVYTYAENVLNMFGIEINPDENGK